MSSDIAIHVENLAKNYLIYNKPHDRLLQSIFRGKQFFKEFQALQPISFSVGKGEALGIVGRNGSGKSTLLQLICGTLAPTSGTCQVNGRISALLELGAGFNPDFTGKENIYLNASILGLSKEEIDQKYDSIVEFSGIADKINQPVKTYSSGMYVRLAFAVAISIDPDILIVDEALAVGDEVFQRKCFSRIQEIQEQGATILFVSHSANTIVQVCNRALLLDQGELLLADTPKSVISYYHKLIFAPEDKVKKVREDIKKKKLVAHNENQLLVPSGQADGVELTKKLQLKSPDFDPHMKPESTVIQDPDGAEISDYEITTLTGEPANLLIPRQEYRINFKVTFTEPIQHARLNFRIRTATGVLLTGSNTTKYDDALMTVEAGQTFECSFSFTCFLLPDSYYITLGCSGKKNKERAPLHTITDAMMFKVMPEPDIQASGFVDVVADVKVVNV